MDFLSSQGFNAIRFPFNHKSMLSDEPIELTGTVKAKSLRGLTYPQMFRSLAQHAAKHGILVLLTCHRTTPGAWPGDGLWFDKDISEKHMVCARRPSDRIPCERASRRVAGAAKDGHTRVRAGAGAQLCH